MTIVYINSASVILPSHDITLKYNIFNAVNSLVSNQSWIFKLMTAATSTSNDADTKDDYKKIL